MADLDTAAPEDELPAPEADQEAPERPEDIEPPPEPEPEPTPEALELRRETEAEARKYGWRARGEFDKDPKGWVDADRYLELPSTINKKLRDELRARDERFDALQRAQEERDARAQAERRQRVEQELAAIRQHKSAAVEKADRARYDQLDAYERQVTAAAAQQGLIGAPVAPQVPRVAPEVAAYVAANEWARDPSLLAEGARIIEVTPGLKGQPVQAQLAAVDAAMRRRYPHLFSPPPAAAAAPVRSRVDAGGLGAGAPKGITAANLTPEARKAGQRFVEQGIFKSLDEYARDLLSEGTQ